MRQTVGILGTPIDRLDTRETLQTLERFIAERRFHQIATANTDFIVNALADAELGHILRMADLVIADGMPLVWMARLLGVPLAERVAGADLVPMLAGLAAEKGYRVFMLGASEEVARQARARLERDYPGLRIVGQVSPPLQPLHAMDSEGILQQIEEAEPDILFVAFGNPKQEKWIHMHRERLRRVPVCIGVGGTFDFLAQRTPRAPKWMQMSGLEWAHRLACDPRRLYGRYLRDFQQFFPNSWRQWSALRSARCRGAGQLRIEAAEEEGTRFCLAGDLVMGTVGALAAAVAAKAAPGAELTLDCSGVRSLDAAALGTLLLLPKIAAENGATLRLAGLSAGLESALRRSRLLDGAEPERERGAYLLTRRALGGLRWRIFDEGLQARLEVTGVSNPCDLAVLEALCRRLRESHVRVVLDTRQVVFVDTGLVAALYRLSRSTASETNAETRTAPFGIVAGESLLAALNRAKALEALRSCLIEPSPVLDSAREITLDGFEPPELRARLSPVA